MRAPEANRAYMKAYNAKPKNRAKNIAVSKARYYAKRGEALQKQQTYYRRNKDLILARDAARRFRISVEEAVLLRGTSHCDVCGVLLTSGQSRTARHIDHDHATGRVRGVLCSRCNLTLGNVDDSTELLEALIVYLRRRQ